MRAGRRLRQTAVIAAIVFVILEIFSLNARAEEDSGSGGGLAVDSEQEEKLDDIQEYLDRQLGRADADGISFSKLMEGLASGDLKAILEQAGRGLKSALFSELHHGSRLLAQVVALGIISAVFANFSSVFAGSQISETGFFVTYLLLFTCLAASFFSSLKVASQVMGQVLEFMKVLMPAYFLAVAFAGGSISSVALYECMLGAITLVQWLCAGALIPVVRVYALMVLAGHIAKEEALTKLTELLEQAVGWSLKTMVGLVLGFHMIQGMILPYVDATGQAGIRKLAELIPGVGKGAGAVLQMVVGSGVLIKNSIGAAAVVVLVVVSVIPVVKLVLLMVLYQFAAAVMQPVCDKRVVSCVAGISRGHKLLLEIVLYCLLLFIVAIALVCSFTNVNYYAT